MLGYSHRGLRAIYTPSSHENLSRFEHSAGRPGSKNADRNDGSAGPADQSRVSQEYLTMHQSARTPSRQVTFLPSS